MPNTMTRGQIQDMVSKDAIEKPEWRKALVSKPQDFLEQRLGTKFPSGVSVKSVEETANTRYVVVPYAPTEGELSDADLSAVAGGKMDEYEVSCDRATTGLGMATNMVINL